MALLVNRFAFDLHHFFEDRRRPSLLPAGFVLCDPARFRSSRDADLASNVEPEGGEGRMRARGRVAEEGPRSKGCLLKSSHALGEHSVTHTNTRASTFIHTYTPPHWISSWCSFNLFFFFYIFNISVFSSFTYTRPLYFSTGKGERYNFSSQQPCTTGASPANQTNTHGTSERVTLP